MLIRILILLLMSPVLLGTSIAGEALDQVVAVVNNNAITKSELTTQTNMMRNQIKTKDMQLPPENVLKKQVLQHLIDVDLQLQLAKNNNISVDDIELDEAIGKIAKSNKLSVSQLKNELASQGLNWKDYRDNIRKELLITHVQQKAIGQDVIISNQQVEDYLKTARKNNKRKQTYHIQNIVVPLSEEPTTTELQGAKQKANALLKKIKAGEDFNGLAIAESSGEFALEGGDLGERHLAELPDVFANEVVAMKEGEVVGPIRTGNGFQLIKLISVSGAQTAHKVMKTHVRHILLKQDSSMTEGEAKRQASNIYQQLKSGKEFTVMAKQYSLDAGSAVNGGDLGWVSAEELVPQFAEKMNALPLKTVSKPVKSPFGWHLIEVLERKTVDDSEAFERQQVRQYLHQRKFTEAVQNWVQHLRTDAYVKIMDKDIA
jgi:peptidyl-prolyl cis-trans isomerase SurA